VSTPRGYYRIGGRHTAPLPTPLPPRGGEGSSSHGERALQASPLGDLPLMEGVFPDHSPGWITQGWVGWGFMRGDPLTHSLGGEAPRSGEGVFVSWREGSPDHSLGDLPPLSGVRGIHGEEGDGSRRPSWVPGRSWIVWGSPPLHGLTTPHKAVP